MTEDKPDYVYIGRKWCGCVVAAMVDYPEGKARKRTADMVWEMIVNGLTIERVSIGSYKLEWDCPHPDQRPVVSPQMSLFSETDVIDDAASSVRP